MEREEEYNYRSDVYRFLYRSFAGHWASSFLARKRELCNNDCVFFISLLNPDTGILEEARSDGKNVGAAVELFIEKFKRLVNSDLAYLAYVNQDKLSEFESDLFKAIDKLDNRISNMFNRYYWRDYCRKSIKTLYYRLILTDPKEPKYQGLGPIASRTLYNALIESKVKIDTFLQNSNDEFFSLKLEQVESESPTELSFEELKTFYNKQIAHFSKQALYLISSVHGSESQSPYFFKRLLKFDLKRIKRNPAISASAIEEVESVIKMIKDLYYQDTLYAQNPLESDPTDSEVAIPVTFVADESSLPYLDYIYDKIVSVDFPASSILLSILRRQTDSGVEFYEKILKMDVSSAREELGIGETSAKEVNRLCEMMRRIVNHAGTRFIFDNSDYAERCLSRFDRRMSQEDVRIYHAYNKIMDSCHNSVLDFYMRVVSIPPTKVKFNGINENKSRDLLNLLKGFISEVDTNIAQTNQQNCSQDNQSTDSLVQQLRTNTNYNSILYKSAQRNLGFTDDQLEMLVSINDKIGHFPLFTAISFLFERMEDREKKIVKHGLNVTYGQRVEDLNDIAPTVELSRERVRQLRDKGIDMLLSYPRIIRRTGLLTREYRYSLNSDYDFKQIRDEEQVDFSNEYITVCVSSVDNSLYLIGDIRKSLSRTSGASRRLYLVPTRLNDAFKFESFIQAIDRMVIEKRFYPYREELETFIRGLIKREITDVVFYDILKECRQILIRGYPDNIINSQLYFPANARKTIPCLIEDILREYNRPMTAEEICEQLNQRYPDLEQIPSKIGSNALRNSNIVAVSKSSTYALVEWNYTEKRGGTIRDIVEEYLNSLIEPIASLSDICEYVAKYRDNVKESSVKTNLLAESSNKFSLYYKGDVMYIGFSDSTFDESFVIQEKRQGRRSFKVSVALLEKFIQDNQRFPYTSGVSAEEIRLSRFLGVCKSNIRKGLLEPDEQAAIERIEMTYEQYKGKKERVLKEDAAPWMDCLENYVTYITINETLPSTDSDESVWFEENKALYDRGQLDPDKRTAFTALVKIVDRMK